ncbi:MAG: hypothetical protein A3F69_01425 [Acidobacteria bacterium RIFCSPLOWO2_12_FULL_66_10]|nr:MAG: hypothetical protein A3F69_01425 [Acidobacteria bacterium RIFCSPLOWO2_12_FULL_66_10]
MQRYLYVRSARASVTPSAVFKAVLLVGGRDGWYFANSLWSVRGFIDRILGGPGMRGGRRDPLRLIPGDMVDFWRVEAVVPDRRLRLFAEMKVPGRAWLEFDIEPDGLGSIVRQTATFDAAGFMGPLYWYAMYPFHLVLFSGMLRAIVQRADRIQGVLGGLCEHHERTP